MFLPVSVVCAQDCVHYLLHNIHERTYCRFCYNRLKLVQNEAFGFMGHGQQVSLWNGYPLSLQDLELF